MKCGSRTCAHNVFVRFFTRGWANGDLPDEDFDSTRAKYADYVESISSRLSPAMRELASLSLHDAVLEQVRWDPRAHELTLTLLNIDAGGDFQAVRITYRNAQLGDARVSTLRSVARDRETEVLETEVDCGPDGVLSHRFLFWPRDEVTVDFDEVSVAYEGRPERSVKLLPYFVEVLPED